MKAGFAILLLSAGVALGQAAPPATPAATNKAELPLSASVQIAINSLGTQRKQIQDADAQLRQEILAVDADVKKERPGWHLDRDSLAVVKDAAAKK